MSRPAAVQFPENIICGLGAKAGSVECDGWAACFYPSASRDL